MNQPPGWGPPGGGPPRPPPYGSPQSDYGPPAGPSGYGPPPGPSGYGPPAGPSGHGPPPSAPWGQGPPQDYGPPPPELGPPPAANVYGLPPGSPGYTPAGQGIGTGKSESNKILMIVGIVVGGVFLLGVLAVGCVVLVASGGSGKPTAREVCEKLVEQGIARNCRSATPRGMSASARDRYDFSLASLPSRTGTALTMSSRADYDRVVDLYRATAILTGPHRYGSARALVFVTLDEKASTSVGNRTRDVVDGL